MTAEREPDLPDPIADVLDIALPAECVAGVAANLRLLGEHWARLRRSVEPAT